MPLSTQEQEDLDKLEFQRLSVQRAQVVPSTQNSGVPRSPDDAQFNAAPEPGIFERARNALSPIIGETRNQKLEREANLGQLKNISPQLGAATEAAIPDAQKAAQEHGIMPTVDTLTKMSGPVAGQMLGAETGAFAPVAIPLFGAIGGVGSDYLAQKRKIAYGEQDMLHLGELVQSGMFGAVPGGSLAKTGGQAIVTEAVKQGLGGLAGETARSTIDEGRLPDVKNAAWATILPALGGAVAQHIQGLSPEIAAARSAAESQVAEKTAVLAKGQAEGMVVPPSLVNPSTVNKVVDTLAGKKALTNQASGINQEVANDIARRVLDPANPDTALTSSVAKAVRQRAYDAGYRPITQVGAINTDAQYASDIQNIISDSTQAARSFPGAVNDDISKTIQPLAVPGFDSGDAVKMVQILRNKAGEAFQKGDNSLGVAQRQAASAIESQIERNLAQRGTPQSVDILNNFRDARKLMAQSHEIEDAIREGGDSIIPSKLGTRFQAGAPLSDGLETVGGMANNFPSATKEASKIPPEPTSLLGKVTPSAILAVGTGSITHSPEAAALAAMAGAITPGARSLLRNLILSKPYQRIMSRIPIHVEANPDMGALIIRQGAQATAAQAADDEKTTK